MGLSRARTPETLSNMSTFTMIWILLVSKRFCGCILLSELSVYNQPILLSGARRVEEIDNLRGDKGAQLAAESMGSGETSLGDALWCCSNLYSDIKLRLSHKRLMIFTCRDNPHEGDRKRDRQACTKADDLKETGENTKC